VAGDKGNAVGIACKRFAVRRSPSENDHGRLAGQQIDGHVDCLPIDAFAVDAEAAHRADGPSIEPTALEQVPARHHMEVALGLHGQPTQCQWISRAGMIGRDQDRMARGLRFAQSFQVANLMTPHALFPPQVMACRRIARNTYGQKVPRYGGMNR
jgi:hypothetical protein